MTFYKVMIFDIRSGNLIFSGVLPEDVVAKRWPWAVTVLADRNIRYAQATTMSGSRVKIRRSGEPQGGGPNQIWKEFNVYICHADGADESYFMPLYDVLNRWPWVAPAVYDPEFVSLKFAVGPVEVSITSG